jgi:exodeoxyribonuclease V alpha subunit
MFNSKNTTQNYSGDYLTSLDIHFADFITKLAGGSDKRLWLAAALVSNFTRRGHICLDIDSVAEKTYCYSDNPESSITCPDVKTWLAILQNASVVGKPGEFKPLILEAGSRLYLYRYWDYQEKLAHFIKQRISATQSAMNLDQFTKSLDRFFPSTHQPEIDWQMVAAHTAATKNFCVISGGPGTGKTTTVAKILALMVESVATEKFKIALVAPTGKAAARMQDAIRLTKSRMECPDRIKNRIPDEASTIHRLLGSIPNSPYFKHNEKNPLPVDVVVVDEASMVDLALMSKLVQALPYHAKLILLGDKDQLASVEAGAVFGDICDRGNAHPYSRQFTHELQEISGSDVALPELNGETSGLQDCIVHLQQSYRFGSESGIGTISRLVNSGAGEKAVDSIKSNRFADIAWIELPQPRAMISMLKDTIIQQYSSYLQAQNPVEMFQRFDRFRILCALREGPFGVMALNTLIEQILKHENMIDPTKNWYHGRPIMITSNDYNLRLFNGDVGICLRDPEANHELRVFFPDVDGKVRKFHPFRLSEHETAYATTVHKSQGSEFDHVLLLLPDRDSPVLTRELIYTGITRARKKVAVWGVDPIFKNAVSRRIERTSGLRDALWD